MQTNEIVGISGNTLTLKDPLPRLPALRQPQVWRTIPANTGGSLGNRWSGIENIARRRREQPVGLPRRHHHLQLHGLLLGEERRGGRRAVEQRPGQSPRQVRLQHRHRPELPLRGPRLLRPRLGDENPGGQAYGIVVGAGSSACLVENNISVNNNKPIALNSTGGGNVIAYNYVDQAVLWNSPGWQESAIDDCHANFTHHDLIEGNWTPEPRRGHHPRQLRLAHPPAQLRQREELVRELHRQPARGGHGRVDARPRLRGQRAEGRQRVPDHALVPERHAHLPAGEQRQGIGGNWDNGYALAHIFRDGNWDNVNKAWSGRAARRRFPPRSTCTGKPAFFGSNAWPWVNPLTGTDHDAPGQGALRRQTPEHGALTTAANGPEREQPVRDPPAAPGWAPAASQSPAGGASMVGCCRKSCIARDLSCITVVPAHVHRGLRGRASGSGTTIPTVAPTSLVPEHHHHPAEHVVGRDLPRRDHALLALEGPGSESPSRARRGSSARPSSPASESCPFACASWRIRHSILLWSMADVARAFMAALSSLAEYAFVPPCA